MHGDVTVLLQSISQRSAVQIHLQAGVVDAQPKEPVVADEVDDVQQAAVHHVREHHLEDGRLKPPLGLHEGHDEVVDHVLDGLRGEQAAVRGLRGRHQREHHHAHGDHQRPTLLAVK